MIFPSAKRALAPNDVVKHSNLHTFATEHISLIKMKRNGLGRVSKPLVNPRCHKYLALSHGVKLQHERIWQIVTMPKTEWLCRSTSTVAPCLNESCPLEDFMLHCTLDHHVKIMYSNSSGMHPLYIFTWNIDFKKHKMHGH